MTQMISGELAAYRTRPQRSDLKLVIYKPQVILAAQVLDAVVQDHDVLIPYVNVTEGVYTSVRPGMTMYVGTLPGKADLGRVRIKDFASNVQLTVARNSIRWTLAPYITIVDYYEIWPMYIREIRADTHTDHFKDWDVSYAGQNYYMGTLLSVGSHVVCNAGESVYWSSSGTVQTQESAVSYNWLFGGGVSGSSNVPNPGWVQYNIPGNYTTRVTALVTGTVQEDVTYRHVVVLGGTVQPYTQFEFDSLNGTRDEGGWHAKITLREANSDAALDGCLVMIYQDNYYGNTHQSYGGNSPNRSHMLFVGYVIDNSITFDYQDSVMEFEVSSPTGRMKLADSSSMEIDSVLTPTNWYEIPYLNGKKALYHYLRWHTTVLNCCDIRWIADDRPLRYVQGEISSMYDLVHKMLDKYLLCEFISDRQGLLWIENHPKSQHVLETHYNDVLTVDRQDWAKEVTFDEINPKKLSYLETGGLAYGGITGSIVNDIMLTGSFTTVLSGAPGNNLRDYFGRADVIQGYYINSQDENNVLVGDIFAYLNATFPAVNIDMSGWYAAMDIAPEEIVRLTLNQNDTRRGFMWDKKPFLIREISIDHKANMLLPSLNLYEVTYGVKGETVPVLPPPNYNTPYGYVLPPYNPIWPIIPMPTPNPPHIPFTVEECWTNIYAPINGPYTYPLGITIQTYGGVISYDVPYHCVIRDGDVGNPTKITLDYTAYSSTLSTPGIGDWTEAINQVAVKIEALNGSGTVVATAVAAVYTGPALGTRTFTFTPSSPVEVYTFRISAVGNSVGELNTSTVWRGKMTGLVPGTVVLAEGDFTYTLHPEYNNAFFPDKIDISSHFGDGILCLETYQSEKVGDISFNTVQYWGGCIYRLQNNNQASAGSGRVIKYYNNSPWDDTGFQSDIGDSQTILQSDNVNGYDARIFFEVYPDPFYPGTTPYNWFMAALPRQPEVSAPSVGTNVYASPVSYRLTQALASGLNTKAVISIISFSNICLAF